MKTKFISALLLLFLSLAIADADPWVPASGSITGHYLLIEHDTDIDSLDAIEFHPDGSCKVDYTGRAGIAASYKFGNDEKMTITLDDGSKAFTYGVKRGKISLKLSNDDADRYYALLPDSPAPVTFNDVLGIYATHNSLGDYATQITADHHFHVHLRDFNPQNHTYFDVFTDGTCTFANGIVTYLPEHPFGTQAVDFIKDALARRDARGLWVISAYDDKLLLETPARDLNFSPPPAGYQATSAP